jgi:hypothetical protein
MLVEIGIVATILQNNLAAIIKIKRQQIHSPKQLTVKATTHGKGNVQVNYEYSNYEIFCAHLSEQMNQNCAK